MISVLEIKGFKLVKGFLADLPSPTNLNYWYGFGVLLGLVYMIQVVRGVFLSLFYRVGEEGAFWRVVRIMQEVYGG